MSTKWKVLVGELYYISYPRSGKFQLENSTIFHVREVKSLTGEFCDNSFPRSTKECLVGPRPQTF